jgi:hypothetical protein
VRSYARCSYSLTRRGLMARCPHASTGIFLSVKRVTLLRIACEESSGRPNLATRNPLVDWRARLLLQCGSEQVRIALFFGVLNDDCRSAQPPSCYPAVRWMDFPTAIIRKNQTSLPRACRAASVPDEFAHRTSRGDRESCFDYLKLNYHRCASS